MFLLFLFEAVSGCTPCSVLRHFPPVLRVSCSTRNQYWDSSMQIMHALSYSLFALYAPCPTWLLALRTFPVMFKAYPWLRAQESLPAGLRKPYVMPRIEPGSILCKTSILLSFWLYLLILVMPPHPKFFLSNFASND